MAYVIPQMKYVNNPLLYILESVGGLGIGAGNLSPPRFQSNGGVPPVHFDTGTVSYPWNSNNDLSGINSNFRSAGGIFDPSSFNSNIQNSNAPSFNGNTGGFSSESFGNIDFSNFGNTNEVVTSANSIENVFVNMLDIIRKFLTLEFGYSFYLAWVAFALGLLASLIVGVGFNSMLKEKRNNRAISTA